MEVSLAFLRKNRRTATGGTSMAGAVTFLGEKFRQIKQGPVNVVVISDGQIADAARTRDHASALAKAVLQRDCPALEVSMTLIRLMSGYGVNYADTSALACLGSLGTTGEKVECVDVSADDVMIETIAGGIRATKMVALDASGPVSRAPHGAQTRSLAFGSTTQLLVGKPVKWLSVDGVECPVQDMGPLTSEAAIDRFLADLLGQSKLWALGGVRGEALEATLAWVAKLESWLTQTALANAQKEQAAMAMGSGSGAGADAEQRVTVRTRAKQLAARVRASATSVLQQFRELSNRDGVAKLNAQQQADWLRDVGAGKSGRALAKRAAGSDWEAELPAAIEHLAGLPPSTSASLAAERVSYFSRASTGECLDAAAELRDVASAVEAGAALQCIGAVGFPFKAAPGNYVDPWTFRMQRLYVGDSLQLAEPDLWLMLEQEQGEHRARQVECPGFAKGQGHVITGVVPSAARQQTGYRRYVTGASRVVMEMQASAQMRGVVAPVPLDSVALVAAALWWLLGQPSPLTSAQQTAFDDLRDTLQLQLGTAYGVKAFKELFFDVLLSKPDVRPYLSAELNIGNALRPVAALLRFQPQWTAAPKHTAHVVRALYGLATYHAAKRHFFDRAEARAPALAALVSADLEGQGTPLQPLLTAEPECPAHVHDGVDVAGLRIPDWAPDAAPFEHLAADLRCAGFELSVAVKAVLVAQALQCKSQAERIDVEALTCVLVDPVDDTHAVAGLNAAKRRIFEADYETRAKAKAAEEADIRLRAAVSDLLREPTIPDFVAGLQAAGIDNRDHAGFAMLHDGLLALSGRDEVNLRKLAVLVTGRKLSHPDQILWARGNVQLGSWAQLATHFNASEFGAKVFQGMLFIRAKYGGHTYRKTLPNRHGHSNDFPSFFGLGYSTMLKMKADVSEEFWLEYVHVHCELKGCCKDHKVFAAVLR